jgi:hypothetical protein
MKLDVLLGEIDKAMHDARVPDPCPVLVMIRDNEVFVDSEGAWYVLPVVGLDVDNVEPSIDLLTPASEEDEPLDLITLRELLMELPEGLRSYGVFTSTYGNFDPDDDSGIEYRHDSPLVDVWWDESGFALLQWFDRDRDAAAREHVRNR